ncbi:MAG: hypothetical protein QOK42_215 [Frankiaceae bacterium]|jgi:DNA-binding CsgD family transcriptional regulator/tetratricopeptide (TPR) repeat protein|nr:hypothetical protein [Frankiaceae bacterium]
MSGGLVERETQLSSLREAFGCAERQQGRLVLLAGEPGAGKTVLAEALAAEVSGRARVLRSVSQDTTSPIPLGILRDAAIQLGDELRAAVRAGGERHDIFEQLLAEVGSHRTPTLWLVDDLQWADEASLDLLRFIARRLLGLPIVVVCTYRDTEVGPALRALLGELATVRDVRRLQVPPLSATAVTLLAPDVQPEQAKALHARSGGNAFFLSELLRGANDGYSGVHDLVLGRIGRLGSSAGELVEVVAVVGDPAALALLAQLRPGVDGLDELVAAGLLVERDPGQVGFRHDIVREAVLSVLAPHRRAELHRRLLGLLGPDAEPAVVVRHAVGAGDRAAVAQWAVLAAERSAAAGAHGNEAEMLALAAASIDDDDTKARLICRQGVALSHASDLDAALGVLEAAESWRCEPATEVERLAALARIHGLRLNGDRARECLDLALLRAEQIPLLERPFAPYAAAAGLAMLRRDRPSAERFGQTALELAHARGDEVACADVRVTLASVGLNDTGDAGPLEKAAEEAHAIGAHRVELRARNNLGSGLSTHGRLAEALAALDRAVLLCARRDEDEVLGRLTVSRAMTLLELGRYDEAINTARQLLADPRQEWRGGPAGITACALARMGQPVPEGLLETELRNGRETADMVVHTMGLVTAAEVAWLGGDAHDELVQLAALHAGMIEGQGWLKSVAAGWSAMLGGVRLQPGLEGMFAFAAIGDFSAAAGAFAAAGMVYQQSLCLYREGSVVSLEAALEILTGIGAVPLADRVRAALRERGVTPRRRRGAGLATQAHPAGLTAREADVLRLLATGLRNADIAEQLVVSQRTVDHHVSSVLRKLGVQSRVGAVRAATALGVIEQT